MTQALVFGAGGQIGLGLLPRLRAHGIHATAVTRGVPPAGDDAVQWLQHDLFGDDPPPAPRDLVFSLGPLDGCVRWLERVPVAPTRLVAFGSTSATTKQASVDPAERALAARLQALERRLAGICADRGVAWTLLCPTLVYGVGRDRNLRRIVQLARRWGFCALPAQATGLRQPVHADDLASAAFAAAFVSASENRRYELAGGEIVRYDEMVRRTLACLQPRPRLLRVPGAAVRVALALAARLGVLRDAGPGVLERLRTDLVFDDRDARRDFGWNPRPFVPSPEMF